ncbi:MAG: FimD/PapC N-terminal domain-containing protein, partial [Carnobacterium maltaromaticum]
MNDYKANLINNIAYISCVVLLFLAKSVYCHDYTFSKAMLGDDVSAADLSLFNNDGQLPGNYYFSVFLNGSRVSEHELISFKLLAGTNDRLLPCLTKDDITHYGINIKKYSELFHGDGEVSRCAKINESPGFSIYVDFNKQKLFINVPQSAILQKISGVGVMPSQLWSDGVPALLLNYDFNTQDIKTTTTNSRSTFIRLRPGINIGPWRLRSDLTVQKPQSINNVAKWQSSFSYAERGINSLKSDLILGESYSAGYLFD